MTFQVISKNFLDSLMVRQLLHLYNYIKKQKYIALCLLQQQLLELVPSWLSALATPGTEKTQCLAHLSLGSTLHLINGILSYIQKLLRSFNDTAIAAFFIITLAWFGLGWTTALPNNSKSLFNSVSSSLE